MSTEKPHPRSMHAHNFFAAAFGCAGHSERAFLHLFGTRNRFCTYPWTYLNGTDPQLVYHEMVAAHWPADFHMHSPMDLSPVFPGQGS